MILSMLNKHSNSILFEIIICAIYSLDNKEV